MNTTFKTWSISETEAYITLYSSQTCFLSGCIYSSMLNEIVDSIRATELMDEFQKDNDSDCLQKIICNINNLELSGDELLTMSQRIQNNLKAHCASLIPGLVISTIRRINTYSTLN